MIPSSERKSSFLKEWPLAVAIPLQAGALGAFCAALVFGCLKMLDMMN